MVTQTYTMAVAEITVLVTRKPVKYLRIKIKPPEGRVLVSVPLGMEDDAVYKAVLSRMDWIRKHWQIMAGQRTEARIQYENGDQIPFLGRNYTLTVVEEKGRSGVLLREPGRVFLFVKPGSSVDARRKVLDRWYRQELKTAILPLLKKWQRIMGVQAREWRIKRMKTRWGTCNIRAKRIWINLELIKQAVHLLEFIIVHELTHLLEPSHNSRFKILMDAYMPDWRKRQKQLKHVVNGR